MEESQPLEQTGKKKSGWRLGKYRWWVLLFIILAAVGTKYYPPVRPEILVASEPIMTEPLFTLPGIGPFYLTNSLLTLLIVVVLLIIVAYSVNRSLKKSENPKGLAAGMTALVELVYGMTETAAGKWTKVIFPWFATYMIYVLVVNMIKMIPGFEVFGWLHHLEDGHPSYQLFGNLYGILPGTVSDGYAVVPWLRGPSTDLNFTLALALISVIATQVVGFMANGPRYLQKFFNFTTLFKKPMLGFIDMLVGILELISEFAKIISFTFRLFGVMFSGVVLVAIAGSLIPVFFPSMVFLLEIFMGLIQAFVFGMLTMVFMVQATQLHGGEEHSA